MLSLTSLRLMLAGSKVTSPPVPGLPLIVTVPLTSASSRDEEPEGAPLPHPQQATTTRPATRLVILSFALGMTVSLPFLHCDTIHDGLLAGGQERFQVGHPAAEHEGGIAPLPGLLVR